MKKIILILGLLMLNSCGNDVGVTENEINGVQQALNFYGGKCHRHKGVSASTDIGNSTFFELEMFESELLELFKPFPQVPSSNIAYLFYNGLGDEKKNYNQVRVKINFSDGTNYKSNYSDKQLKEYDDVKPVLFEVAKMLKENKYKELSDRFVSDVDVKDEQIKLAFEPQNKQYGNIKETQLHGFQIINDETYGELIQIMGVLIRETNDTRLSVVINKKSKEIITIRQDF